MIDDIENEQPHVSNPLKYAKKTIQMMKENVEDCYGYSFMLHVGLANRYIEDAYFGKQINGEQMKDMYKQLSNMVTEFGNKCKCTCTKKVANLKK